MVATESTYQSRFIDPNAVVAKRKRVARRRVGGGAARIATNEA